MEKRRIPKQILSWVQRSGFFLLSVSGCQNDVRSSTHRDQRLQSNASCSVSGVLRTRTIVPAASRMRTSTSNSQICRPVGKSASTWKNLLKVKYWHAVAQCGCILCEGCDPADLAYFKTTTDQCKFSQRNKFALLQTLRIKRDFINIFYIDWLRAGRPKGWSLSPGRVKNFFFSTSSRPALGSIQHPIQWVPGGSFLGSKAVGA
jgi:hypothetical protein